MKQCGQSGQVGGGVGMSRGCREVGWTVRGKDGWTVCWCLCDPWVIPGSESRDGFWGEWLHSDRL